MKEEELAPWINSNHGQQNKMSDEQRQRMLQYTLDLQQDADNLFSAVIILVCLLLSVAGVLWVMYVNGLIVH
jgi:hypothetical protein